MNGLDKTEWEFRYSRAFCHVMPDGQRVMAWHGCSNKPFSLPYDEYVHIHSHNLPCPNCGQAIIGWDKMNECEEPETEREDGKTPYVITPATKYRNHFCA